MIHRATQTANTESNNTHVKKIVLPPIFVPGVNIYKGMMDHITSITSKEHFPTKEITNEAVKVSVTDVESYHKLVNKFRARDIIFFMYQMKHKCAFNVVIRNFHHSINTEEIKEALQNDMFSIGNISNIQNAKTEKPLLLFFVNVELVDEYKNIYELKVLLQHRITAQSFRPRKTVVQYMR